MRSLAIGCLLLLATSIVRSEDDSLIDLTIVMTAPADKYGTESIEELFKRSMKDVGVTYEKLTVERIGTYADYLALCRIIADPKKILRQSEVPEVYYVDRSTDIGGARTYVVHETDFAKPVAGIAVRHRMDSAIQTSQWKLEAADTLEVFRAHAPETGDFYFTPDPTLQIESFQLLYGDAGETTDWIPWPGARARFLTSVRGFPTKKDPTTGEDPYMKLKKRMRERTSRIDITAESSSTLSIADALYEQKTPQAAPTFENGLVSCEVQHEGADRVWFLMSVTPEQQKEVARWIKDGINDGKLSEFSMAKRLIDGEAVANFPVVPATPNRQLDGKTGPEWFELEKSGQGFLLTLQVTNVNDWQRRFSVNGNLMPGLCVAVFEKDGECIRFEEGDFWTVLEVAKWLKAKP